MNLKRNQNIVELVGCYFFGVFFFSIYSCTHIIMCPDDAQIVDPLSPTLHV